MYYFCWSQSRFAFTCGGSQFEAKPDKDTPTMKFFTFPRNESLFRFFKIFPQIRHPQIVTNGYRKGQKVKLWKPRTHKKHFVIFFGSGGRFLWAILWCWVRKWKIKSDTILRRDFLIVYISTFFKTFGICIALSWLDANPHPLDLAERHIQIIKSFSDGIGRLFQFIFSGMGWTSTYSGIYILKTLIYFLF